MMPDYYTKSLLTQKTKEFDFESLYRVCLECQIELGLLYIFFSMLLVKEKYLLYVKDGTLEYINIMFV